MLPKVITLHKTLAERKREYAFLLDETRPCSSMSAVWSEELEIAIEQFSFQAIWKFSLEDCKYLKVLYPTSVLVNVKEIDCSNLVAMVTVEGVQEDIEFDDIMEVHLFDLIPTESQPYGTTILKPLIDILDRFRYFYDNLWYPWDLSDCETIAEWALAHVDARLQLNHDMAMGVLDKATIRHLKSFLPRALKIKVEIESNEEDEPNEERKMQCIRSLSEEKQMKMELDFWESPELRDAMQALLREKKETPTGAASLVCEELTLEEMMSYLEMGKSLMEPKTKIRVQHDLLKVMEMLTGENTALVTPARYKLPDLELDGGHIKGLGRQGDVIITPVEQTPRRFLFLSCLGPVSFENITFERSDGGVVLVSNNTLKLVGCFLKGIESRGRGVVVKAGCRLEMTNCELSGFDVAVILNEKANAVVSDCRVTNCNQGFKVMDDSSLSLSKVKVNSCSSAVAVCAKTANMEKEAEGISLSSNFKWDFLSAENCEFTSNKVDAFFEKLN